MSAAASINEPQSAAATRASGSSFYTAMRILPRSQRQAMFEIRESDRDTAFIRRHLTEELIRELDLFQYRPKGDDLVISGVADEEGWQGTDRLIVSFEDEQGIGQIQTSWEVQGMLGQVRLGDLGQSVL